MYHTYVDTTGVLAERCHEPIRIENYAFILCAKGECKVSIYMNEHIVKEDCVITLLPNSYFRVIEQTPDTELYVITFKQSILSSHDLYSAILDHLVHIVEFPVVEFEHNSVEIMSDYIKLLIRMEEFTEVSHNCEFVSSMLKQFIILIGAKRKIIEDKVLMNDRAKALVMKVIKIIVTNYCEERSPAFYAQQMHITPQHLSTVVKKVLGMTITDLIAQFVIIDAQTKLTSTDLSIKEIAEELNFEDMSTFGKYFKRYTELSPRQYRSSKQNKQK